MDTVVVKDVVKAYGDFKAVNRISFSVRKGEIFGLLGPNGAGKTTTIKMLTTLVPPTSGTMSVNGHDVVKEPLKVKESLGWIASEVILDDDLQVIENLKLQASLQGVYGWEKQTYRLLDYFGIKNALKMKVGKMSTGMRKKLEIVMALLSEPSVIFMDEPTIGLDVGTRKMLWGLIREIREKHNVTIFLTTHYMDEADELCDRIAIINKGKIVAIGTPEQLKAKVGGGVVSIVVADDFSTGSLKGTKFERKGNEINIHLSKGDDAFVKVLKQMQISKVKSLKLIMPSLDSVFLKLTGTTMGEEEASGPIDYRKFYATIRRARQ